MAIFYIYFVIFYAFFSPFFLILFYLIFIVDDWTLDPVVDFGDEDEDGGMRDDWMMNDDEDWCLWMLFDL